MTPARENDWVRASDGLRARKNGAWAKEKLSFLDEFVPPALQATGAGRHLAVPFQIPVLMIVSERGTLGEFNIGQSLVARTMRPVLQALAVEHHTMTRLDEVEFIIDRSITQAVATQAPCVFILSPLLTGGKVFAK